MIGLIEEEQEKESHQLEEAQTRKRNVVGELLKENDQLKRDLHRKTEECGRLVEKSTNNEMIIARQAKTIANLKNKRVIPDNEEESNGDKNRSNSHANNSKSRIVIRSELPKSIQFLLNGLSVEDRHILASVQDYGPSSFANLYFSNKGNLQKKNQIVTVVCRALSDQREFLERLLALSSEFCAMMNSMSLLDLCQRLYSETDCYFNSKRMRLWVLDKIKGVFFTFDEKSKKLEASTKEGAFGESFETHSTIYCNKRNAFLLKNLHGNETAQAAPENSQIES